MKWIKKFLHLGTQGPKPHGTKDGLKRIPVHLVTMGLPAFLVCLLIPPGPWKWIPAAIMTGQAIRGELEDVQDGSDTKTKAVLDGLSQSILPIIGAIL